MRMIVGAVLASVLALSGCAFVPAGKPSEFSLNGCQFHTPEWELSVKEIDALDFCEDSDDDEFVGCLFTAGIIIPVGSFVVSGSFVLLGNTIHWLEYQGTCEDSLLRQKLGSFKKA